MNENIIRNGVTFLFRIAFPATVFLLTIHAGLAFYVFELSASEELLIFVALGVFVLNTMLTFTYTKMVEKLRRGIV